MNTQRQGSCPGAISTSKAPQIGPRTHPSVSTAPTSPKRGGPPARGKKVADHGHRHRQQGAAARALQSPPRDHAWQVTGECADDRSDEKECQRALECQCPAHDVGEPAHDRNGHDVGEEIAIDDPDVPVDVGGIDPQVGHHPGQDRRDDREIESAQEDRQQGGAQCTTVGRSQVHRRRGRLDRRLDRDVFAMMGEVQRPHGGVRPLRSRRLRETRPQQVMRLLIDPQVDRHR